jgi:hypothetical protein
MWGMLMRFPTMPSLMPAEASRGTFRARNHRARPRVRQPIGRRLARQGREIVNAGLARTTIVDRNVVRARLSAVTPLLEEFQSTLTNSGRTRMPRGEITCIAIYLSSKLNSVCSASTSAVRPESLFEPYFLSVRSLANGLSKPPIVTRCSPATTPSPSFSVVSV